MATKVRLPTTPVPPPSAKLQLPDGQVSELSGLLVLQDAADRVAEQVTALLVRCDAVIVVDRGSRDGTAAAAVEAGARVLSLPPRSGEGDGLRAGMRLARELGYIGAVVPGADLLAGPALEALCLAHVRAPEALIVGVGPGEALAGKEWDEVNAVAEGREPEPYPDWRPPKASGLPGAVERWFERLVETRFGYPWGGPRLLPLQGVLRRDLREPGEAVHMELLALSVASGIPTVEIELPTSPTRPVVLCRKAALRLLARFVTMTVAARGKEKLGLGGGYAPPTNSPLQLLLAASVAVFLAIGLSGCPKPIGPAQPVAQCEQEMPRATWPGEGEAQVALQELVTARAGVQTVWVEQGVTLRDPAIDGSRKLRGVLARGGPDRLRLRLLAPMGFTVLDYVEVAGDWQLSVPSAGLFRQGGPGDPILTPDEIADQEQMVRPDLVAALLRSVAADAEVRWRAGACAVLEELSGGAVVRRVAYRPVEAGWEVATEEVLSAGEVRLAAVFTDYRPVDGSVWPHRQEITDPLRGSSIVLETKALRTEGVTDAFFAMREPD